VTQAAERPNENVSPTEGEKPFLPRWAMWVAIPGLVGPLFILGFIFVSERAHEEARCPYARVSEQTAAPGIVVREERRSCMPGVEDRRYSAVRGDQVRVLGRRRFAPEAFAAPKYSWKASVSEKGEVQVVVENPGHGTGQFREGTREELEANERAR
jgi:hypothetical protein